MRTTTLRQFLQSLCFESPWNYAVFWKLQHQCPTVLTWEDGYFEIPCATEPKRYFNGNYYRKGLNDLSTNCGSRSDDGYLGEHPIGLAMAEMSSTYHFPGKGLVGEVASLCIPRWISSNCAAAAEPGSGSIAECPDEWLLQFVAGIKTILLVPCVPYGVLQLGSMERVAENMELVVHLVEEFDFHLKLVENFLPCRESCESLLQSTGRIATLSESSHMSSATTTYEVNENGVAADIPILKDHKLSTAFQMTSIFEVQDAFHLFGKHMPNVLESANESNISMQQEYMIDLVQQLNYQHSNDNRSGMTENSLGRSSCHEEDVGAFSYSSCNLGFYSANALNEVDFYFDGDMLDPQSMGKDCSETILRNFSNSLSFPRECELQKTNRSTIQDDANHCTNNLSGLKEYNGWFLKEDDTENLLEAVVASACCTYDDYSPHKATGQESFNTPLGRHVPLFEEQRQSIEDASLGDSSVSRSTLTTVSAGADRNASTNSSISASTFNCIVSTFSEGQHQTKVSSSLGRGKESNTSNSYKKRGRLVDSRRPRPRDRQLIQGRIKELRELVPNSAKCSIDGLLGRTIEHMLFLRSVTNQADKLRCQAQKEVSHEKSPHSAEVKTEYQQGTCWALELGSEDQKCPIIVKDLEYPGHMLIEMMCDDHGHFLEIADVIHGLELTVLKGVMEKRSGNSWAHFIVEASENLHRQDIFWPLMQLLQQGRSSISSKM